MNDEERNKIIEDAVYNKLINTFKKYPTAIQDTLLRLITIRLQELYTQIDLFPDILLGDDNKRYDILQAKAEQFDFNINNEYSLSEQIKLLNKIYYIYSKRGSIESIEHMWKYYGGNLPKDVTVTIPANELFRYSISKLSGTHRFEDGVYYRAGVYTIVIDGDYDLDSLREFVLQELVTAGRRVYFNKRIFSYLLDGDDGSFASDNIWSNVLIKWCDLITITKSGLMWSVNNKPYTWSGSPDLFVDIRWLIYLDAIVFQYIPDDIEIGYTIIPYVRYTFRDPYKDTWILNYIDAICTPIEDQYNSIIHYFDINGEEKEHGEFSGYFVLGVTNLKEVINRYES